MTSSPDDIDIVRVKEWSQYPWLQHGFSTRAGGVSRVYGGYSLNLSWTKEDDPNVVAENRKRFVHAVTGASNNGVPFALIGARQIHSSIVHELRDSEQKLETSEGKPILEGDGLITGLPGVLIAVATADCVPVLVVDIRKRVVAAFHAGWRGTASRIVENGVATLQQSYDSRPEDIVAAIGPSIGSCCYSVGKELHATFASNFSYAGKLFHTKTAPAPSSNDASHLTPGDQRSQTYLDLWEANRRQLLDAGVLDTQITVLAECTACTRNAQGQLRHFSHRGERGISGRMLSVAGILKNPLHGRGTSRI